MRRKRKDSTAVMHGSEPLIVHEMDPIDDHPALGPLTRRKIRKLGGKGKAHVKVNVQVEAKAGKGSE